MSNAIKIINAEKKKVDLMIQEVIEARTELNDKSDYIEFDITLLRNFDSTIRKSNKVSAWRYHQAFNRLLNEIMKYKDAYNSKVLIK